MGEIAHKPVPRWSTAIWTLGLLWLLSSTVSAGSICQQTAEDIGLSSSQAESLCLGQSGEADPYAVGFCLTSLYSRIKFDPSKTGMASVCAGAHSDGPALCMIEALKLMGLQEAALICAEARDSAPAQCFSVKPGQHGLKIKATLTDSEKLALCSGTARLPLAPWKCLEDIFSEKAGKVLSREGKIDLCSGSLSSNPIRCFHDLEKAFGSKTSLTARDIAAMCGRGGRTTLVKSCISIGLEAGLTRSIIKSTCNSKSQFPLYAISCIASFKKNAKNDFDELTAAEMCKLPSGMNSNSLSSSVATDQLELVEDHGSEVTNSSEEDIKWKARVEQERLLATSPSVCHSSADILRNRTLSAQLCRGAIDSEAPRECYRATSFLQADNQLRVNICSDTLPSSERMKMLLQTNGSSDFDVHHSQQGPYSGKTSSTKLGVVECLRSAPFGLSAKAKAKLCQGAVNDAPAQCYKALPSGLTMDEKTKGLGLELCQTAFSVEPAVCIARKPASLALKDAIDLCRGAKDGKSIVDCVNHLPTHLDGLFKVLLCRGSGSQDTSSCFKNSPSSWTIPDRIRMCLPGPNVFEHGHSKNEPSDVDSPLVSSWLRQFVHVLERLSNEMVSSQAGAVGHRGSEEIVRCAGSAPSYMSTPEKVTLCSGAASMAPTECARVLDKSILHPSLIALLCQGANSTMPALCVRDLYLKGKSGRGTLGLIDSQILQDCKTARSIPSKLKLVQLFSECGQSCGEVEEQSQHEADGSNRKECARKRTIIPGCKWHATVHILDQFGHHRTMDNDTVVRVSAKASSGGKLEGQTSTVVKKGVASFSEMYFRTPGNYTVYFTAKSKSSRTGSHNSKMKSGVEWVSLEADAAAIEVVRDEIKIARLERCRRILTSVLQTDEAGTLHAQDEIFGALAFPQAMYVYDEECLNQITILGGKVWPGWKGTTFFQCSKIAFSVLIENGIPRASESPWERLGIPEGSNASTIKKAFYKRSREWHPDRWATSGDSVKEMAAEVFDAITDAYVELSGSHAAEQAS